MNRPSILDGLSVDGLKPKQKAKEARIETPKQANTAKGEAEMFRTSLYMSRAVHDVLREIAYTERKKVHELFMEGIDQVLKSRRHPSSREITSNAKAS